MKTSSSSVASAAGEKERYRGVESGDGRGGREVKEGGGMGACVVALFYRKGCNEPQSSEVCLELCV